MFRFMRSFRLCMAPIRSINVPRITEGGVGPSYYVIPEIPPETCKNAFDLQSLSLPKISELTPDVVFNGFSRLLIDFQINLSKLSEEIKSGTMVVTSSNLLHALDEIFYPIEHAIQIVRAMLALSRDPLWPLIFSRLFKKFKNYRYEYFSLDPAIYGALLTLRSSGVELSNAEKELLNTLIDECWSNGAELAQTTVASKNSKADTKRFNALRAIREDIEYEEQKFLNMVIHTASVAGYNSPSFKYTRRYPSPSPLVLLVGDAHIGVAESDLAPSAPAWLPAALGGQQDGGHVAGMKINVAHDSVVRTLLRHCCTREVRHSVWFGWVQRASNYSFGGATGHHADNDYRIENLRRMRIQYAKQLGCEDWLSYIWRCKHLCSPPSPDWLISNVLEPLREQLFPIGQNELQRLTEWASINLDIPDGKLEPWDLDYAIEQYNLAVCPPRLEERVKSTDGTPFVPFLITRLNKLASLFELRLVLVESTTDHASYICRVEDSHSGQPYGEIILDLFDKPDRPLTLDQTLCVPLSTYTHLSSTGVNVRPLVGKHSTVAMVNNLPESVETDGISNYQWLALIHTFGNCLQAIVPRAHHHDPSSGLACFLSPDMQYLTADLFTFLAPHVFGAPSVSATSNEKRRSSSAPFYTVPTTGTPIIALPSLRLLYETRLDLALFSRANKNRPWPLVNDQCWTSHLPYPRHLDDSWPCSAMSMFAPGSQPGLQYQHVWRHLLFHDVVAGLPTDGLRAGDPSKVNEILKRYRDVIISAEDLLPPAELFRRFRGRDPSPTYLFDVYRIHPKQAVSAVPPVVPAQVLVSP